MNRITIEPKAAARINTTRPREMPTFADSHTISGSIPTARTSETATNRRISATALMPIMIQNVATTIATTFTQ